mgnify:CR=1 FL=1
MKTNVITKVNNIDIIAISENNHQMVPIRPICNALGVDYSGQLKKIKEYPDLSLVVDVTPTTGADGKTYEMTSLPIQFVFGWLFTINPKNVKPEAQESVRQYRLMCYKALYEYFSEPQTFLREKQIQMEKYVNVYQEKQHNFKNARNEMQEAKKQLNQVMSVTIEEWKFNNRQLILDFESAEDAEELEEL